MKPVLNNILPLILLFILAILPAQNLMASVNSHSISPAKIMSQEKLLSSPDVEHKMSCYQTECSGAHCVTALIKLPVKLFIHSIKSTFLLNYNFALNSKFSSSLFRPPKV